MTAARELARFAVDVRRNGVPEEVQRKGAIVFLNLVGVAISNRDKPQVRAASTLAKNTGVAHLWGTGRLADEYSAALINGLASHISDFDDTHPEGGLHPSGVLAPALIAIGEAEGLNGEQVLRAFIVGQEIMARIASTAPHRFTLRGLHASSVCGVVAAAGAVAMARGQDEGSIAHAMGIAASQASGVIQTVLEGGDLKSFHLGWAAMSSLWAARLAEAGIQGPELSLEGPQGLLGAFLGEEYFRAADLDRLSRGLGREWETLAVVPKPYPCCHFTHAIIDAAQEFVNGGGDVKSAGWVRCLVPREAVSIVCEPWSERVAPTSAYAAKFSLPFITATALSYGAVTDANLERALTDPRVAAVANRVHYEVDDDPGLAHTYGAELQIQQGDETVWSRRVLHPTGSKQTPVPDSLVIEKFVNLVEPLTGVTAARALAERLAQLERETDLRGLFEV